MEVFLRRALKNPMGNISVLKAHPFKQKPAHKKVNNQLRLIRIIIIIMEKR